MRTLYAALGAYLEMFIEQRRASGRTTKLIEEAQPGDWIFCGSSKEMRRIDNMLRSAGKRDVRVSYVASVGHLMRAASERGPVKGRILFDHFALEEMYRSAIMDVELGKRK